MEKTKIQNKEAINKKIDTLVEQAQNGDSEAFGEIYNHLLTSLYRYLYFKVGGDIAEDLTEETFFKAWQNLNSYRKKEGLPFTAWLFRIAHNMVVDYYRNHQLIEELPMDIQETRKSMQPNTPVEDYFTSERLYQGLKKLSSNVEQAIILRFINDLSYKEIAQVMNKTEGAIRVLIHRGLSQLREILS